MLILNEVNTLREGLEFVIRFHFFDDKRYDHKSYDLRYHIDDLERINSKEIAERILQCAIEIESEL